MLVRLGRRTQQGDDVVARLLECHERIRRFCALACKLASAPPTEQARDAALELVRYFTVGLPLHVADEEQSLRPRLAAIDGGLQEALTAMDREHREGERILEELVAGWRALAGAVTADACAATLPAARALDDHMQAHLAAEERLLFPALTRLSRTQADAIIVEMRARRS